MRYPVLSSPAAKCLSAIAAVLVGCGGGGGSDVGVAPADSFAVAKANCSPDDRAETGLQGQIPMNERAAGFKGFNCNLQMSSAAKSQRGEGTFQQFALVRDRAGRLCGFSGGAFLTNEGTSVVDLTDPSKAVETTVLRTSAMLNPGEGLKVHEARGLLVSAYYVPTPMVDAEVQHGFDVYDVGTDCRYPQLLASTTSLSFSTEGMRSAVWQPGTRPAVERIWGHEGAFAPDGLTYYVGDTMRGVYHAIDITDPTRPQHLTAFQSPGFAKGGISQGMPHNLALSNDGKLGYFTNQALDRAAPGGLIPQTGEWHNGFMVLDTSEVQARKPNGKIKFLKEVSIRDSAAQQMALPVMIAGQPYVLAIGEMGTGQATKGGIQSACAAGVTPFAMVQLFHMKADHEAQLINKIRLEVNDPKNCQMLLPEVAAIPATDNAFMYDVHHCSVDNRDNATTLACGYFQSGIRVYDIRDPRHIKEVAYFVPPALGSEPGWCASLPFLDASNASMYSVCADSGVVALRFKNGSWPFPQSSTPQDKQL